jgi:2-amino-4-hydroxy-6-hydroxymethyldihydropteridine diphosphokinase
MRYFLGLGSNLGDSAENLAAAAERLERKGVRIVRKSSIFRTEPVGMKDQPWFLNQAVEAETALSPSGLFKAVKAIERAMGRKPGPRNGPRPIDIDILLSGDIVLKTPDLVIPHVRLAERRFVLVPLAEIAPAAIHPLAKKTMKALLRDCPDRSKVLRVRLSGLKRKYPEPD